MVLTMLPAAALAAGLGSNEPSNDAMVYTDPVSYTHLDVYKRQEQYLQAVADNEPSIIPWDANPDYASYMRQIVMDQEQDLMYCSQNASMIPG